MRRTASDSLLGISRDPHSKCEKNTKGHIADPLSVRVGLPSS